MKYIAANNTRRTLFPNSSISITLKGSSRTALDETLQYKHFSSPNEQHIFKLIRTNTGTRFSPAKLRNLNATIGILTRLSVNGDNNDHIFILKTRFLKQKEGTIRNGQFQTFTLRCFFFTDIRHFVCTILAYDGWRDDCFHTFPNKFLFRTNLVYSS